MQPTHAETRPIHSHRLRRRHREIVVPRHAWWAYMAVFGGLSTLFHFLPWSDSNLLLYVSIASARVVATWWSTQAHRPPVRRPWYLLTFGTAAWTVGETLQALGEMNGTHGRAVNAADACYLVGFAALAGAFLLLGRGVRHRGPTSGVLDALIVFTAFAVPAWAFLVTPTTLEVVAHGLPATLRMIYPVLDLVLVSALLWMGAAPEVRTPAYRVLVLSLVCWAGAETGYHLDSFSSGTSAEVVQDALLLSHVLWGTAMLMPSLPGFWRRRDHSVGEYTTGRLAMVLVATMTAPVTLVIQFWTGGDIDVVTTTIGGAVMAALLTIRFRRLIGRISDQSERLDAIARLDVLTGLPNRRSLNDRLQAELDGCRGAGRVAVLAIDLDRFKGYNDAFGHRVGDELLVAVARRWRSRLADDVFLARTGGDEFCAIVVGDEADAIVAARALVGCLQDPVVVRHLVLAVDVSVGVSCSTDRSTTAESLLHDADQAMYAAKARQSRVEVHRADLDDGADERVLLLNDLRWGLERGELTMHFQPQLDLATGRVSGVEALIRWFHPVRGAIAPGAFLPAAETTGLIREVTRFALRTSLAAARAWRDEGRDLRVGVNVPALSLVDPAFVDDVFAELRRHDLPPSALDLEVTESVAMVDIGGTAKVLDRLSRHGVRLSIDDFGTGHSSLGYLQRLPMDVIKIDQSFVRTMSVNECDEMIVRSTIGLAEGLGLETVAEGVEDLLVLDHLRALGCATAQGFAIARPMPADELVAAVDRIEAVHRRDRSDGDTAVGGGVVDGVAEVPDT